ncbi:MAG: hypothetical protein Q8J80_05060 [Gallionella sp.]|nr:hypothetical protein [Gallionella sp.]
MDLVGSVKYIENRLGERKPSQGKGKPVPKHPHATDDGKEPVTAREPEGHGDGIGRVIDVSA